VKEETLIAQCLDGDRHAQKALYMNYKDRLFAVCLRYAADRDEAHDILQDGYVKIYRDLKSYRPIASLYSWMRTVMVRTALECIRRKKSRIGRDLDASTYQEILSLIRTLPEELKTVFNLYAIDGYSHKEIAEMCGISEGNSKVRLNRARKKLKEKVNRLFELN